MPYAGIMGHISSLTEQQYLCHASTLKKKPRQEDMFFGIKQILSMNQTYSHIIFPPITYVSHLEDIRRYDRCTWSIIGKIDIINSIKVKSKCSKCHNYTIADKNIGRLNMIEMCPSCQEILLLKPYWESTISISDNTGVCNSMLEGENVLEMLKIICGPNKSDLYEFIKEAEELVFRVGSVVFDTFKILRNSTMEEISLQDKDIDRELSNSNPVNRESSEALLLDASIAMSNHVLDASKGVLKILSRAMSYARENRSIMENIRFIVQIIHNASTSISRDDYLRDISVQIWNDNEDDISRYSNSMRNMKTVARKPLVLDCRHVSRVSVEQSVDDSFKLLGCL